MTKRRDRGGNAMGVKNKNLLLPNGFVLCEWIFNTLDFILLK